jgi:hypothetical protein
MGGTSGPYLPGSVTPTASRWLGSAYLVTGVVYLEEPEVGK